MVLVVLAAALAGLLVWQGLALRSEHLDDQRRDQALRVAQSQVIDLTTMDSGTVTSKIQAMSARASGSFKEQLTGITQAFVDAVTRSKISARGSIDSAAVSAYSHDRAEVIVASTANVTSGENAQPVIRTYRMKVSLEWISGRWFITGMEFVS
jgi:Mce-associated membrane protein